MAGILLGSKRLRSIFPRDFSAANSGCQRLRSNRSSCFLDAGLVSVVGPIHWAGVGGSIAGTVRDPSGAVIPKATVTATNTATGIRQTAATDDKGFYSFPSLPIGHYDLEITSTAFRPYRRTGIVLDANSCLDNRRRSGARAKSPTS